MPGRSVAARCGGPLVALALAAAVTAGWINRDELPLTPETGVGYWLGIAGATSMVLLLVYPLRKRMPALAAIGSTALWFRIHMLLGSLAPVLVLFHASFTLGAPNSNVALATTLLVAASGVVGRYLYGRVHAGLVERKALVEAIASEAAAVRAGMSGAMPQADAIGAEIEAFRMKVLGRRNGLAASLVVLIRLGGWARASRRRVRRMAREAMATHGAAGGWSRRERRAWVGEMTGHTRGFYRLIRRAALFSVYDRLFAFWHVLHMPLFFLLVIAATAHVVAVHLY